MSKRKDMERACEEPSRLIPTCESCARLRTERDEALVALNDAKKALKIMNQNLDDLSRAKQEALAQVAVLILALEDALSEIHYNLGCDARCEEKRHVLADPLMKARALLDRLAMLEDGAMTNQRLVWLEDRLQQLEEHHKNCEVKA